MDISSIQDSLTLLENRYRELKQIGDRRLELWEQERAQCLEDKAVLENEKTALKNEKTALKNENTVLEQEKALFKKENNEAQVLIGELNQSLDQATESLAKKELDLKDSSEEVHCLLLQLHKTQEDIESLIALNSKIHATSDALIKKLVSILTSLN